VTITGDRTLDRKLKSIANKTAKKAMRAGVRAGLGVIVKAIKSEVPANMKDAKRAIGSRFGKNKTSGVVEAKAGAGVGIKFKKIRKQDSKQKEKRKGRPGVGVGARNIQWFILGTAARETGSKRVRTKGSTEREKTGNPVHSTGTMEAQMPDIVKAGTAKSESAAVEKIRSKIAETIDRDVRAS